VVDIDADLHRYELGTMWKEYSSPSYQDMPEDEGGWPSRNGLRIEFCFEAGVGGHEFSHLRR
jgi:hypothetical protein